MLVTHLTLRILAPLAAAQPLRILSCAPQLLCDVREPLEGRHRELDGGVAHAAMVALRADHEHSVAAGRRRGAEGRAEGRAERMHAPASRS